MTKLADNKFVSIEVMFSNTKHVGLNFAGEIACNSEFTSPFVETESVGILTIDAEGIVIFRLQFISPRCVAEDIGGA